MFDGINIICFSASYAVAFALALLGLWARPAWRRPAMLLAASAGVVAHTWYLVTRVQELPAAPLSSPHDWYIAVAGLLALAYLALALYYPRRSLGLFMLPVVLGLVGAAALSQKTTLASLQIPRFWTLLHAGLLMGGTVAVLVGFVTGIMYLLQSSRLKRKQPIDDRFRLPSLEWLERVNSRSLGTAALLVGFGFLTGVLSQLARGNGASVPWTDPVVLSLAAMLLWLIVAEGFRIIYPAARRGRKVAYLTLAAFAFLLLTLASFTMQDTLHGENHSVESRSTPTEAEMFQLAKGVLR
ncbi:cytochrome c biogenesis protein CcsA [Adhaeretor mobilis]|uniref:Cytochrome C assembly protein n=1 Tax=Adhaeretor mobilis TaxID=1930276 RepID=A0A517N3Q7_9BACT|nr:cytochrome c biogenesis protein CcsA [Adhaeretor mobilis]QDT01628.1 Cytochrome C assembly protein [Adhaeretor mobilis]